MSLSSIKKTSTVRQGWLTQDSYKPPHAIVRMGIFSTSSCLEMYINLFLLSATTADLSPTD
jgi:hypothetical protein